MRGAAGSCTKACSRANSPSKSLASFFTADDLNTESSWGHFVSGRSGGGNMFLSLLRSSLASGLEKEDATVAMLFSDSLGAGSPLERSLISSSQVLGSWMPDGEGHLSAQERSRDLMGGSVAET